MLALFLFYFIPFILTHYMDQIITLNSKPVPETNSQVHKTKKLQLLGVFLLLVEDGVLVFLCCVYDKEIPTSRGREHFAEFKFNEELCLVICDHMWTRTGGILRVTDE